MLERGVTVVIYTTVVLPEAKRSAVGGDRVCVSVFPSRKLLQAQTGSSGDQSDRGHARVD